MYVDLHLPPGVYRNGTDLQSAGRWRDASLVRWHEGTMQPVGGWSQKVSLATTPRGLLTWRDNSANRWIAAGSASALQVAQGGGAVWDITPAGLTSGLVDAEYNTGYGGAFYGTNTYGAVRPDTGLYSEATTWSLATWGENLLACSSADGGIYEWTLNTSNVATALANAPTGNRAVFVTAERVVFALGAGGDQRKIQWSDRENNTLWTPAATNEAGDATLETEGQLMQAVAVPQQTFILTDRDAYRAQYIGPPFVYSFARVGTACGTISRKGCAVAGDAAFWMGAASFFVYRGGVVEPLPSEVSDYVFSDINASQLSKVYAVSNQRFKEVWWFYPSNGSVENDRYVVFNYQEGHWATGELARTAGVDAGVFRYPTWSDAAGELYDHDVGALTSGAYAESGPLRMGAGTGVFTATSFIPDEKTQGGVSLTFKSRLYPNAAEASEGPYSAANPVDIRVTGRQLRMRLDGTSGQLWRFGSPSIQVQQRGRR